MYIHELQYNHLHETDLNLRFNPYVELIHDDLNMNAYAFSVDDAVGFMSELGDGLVFTVGGPKGLENEQQFSYADGGVCQCSWNMSHAASSSLCTWITVVSFSGFSQTLPTGCQFRVLPDQRAGC